MKQPAFLSMLVGIVQPVFYYFLYQCQQRRVDTSRMRYGGYEICE